MDKKALEAVALSVRSLSMDAVEKANSGHPGLPMGLAELGSLLFGELLHYYPGDPKWPNRDRFVLSAGHGSMLLYSLLHLSGFDMSLDDLKHFRQVGSRTPGHPEYGHTEGVETTTGPLGQGISNAVGFAIAEQMKSATFNTESHRIVDHYTYVIAGDGDLMEGISSEACSLAGHLQLGKLIVFYDANSITIEGSTKLAFTEDVRKRFEAYGWQVLSGDAYDADGIRELVAKARADSERPTLIYLPSIIGKGAPNKAGTAGVHGAALGPEEIVAARKNLGLREDQEFFIHPDAVQFFKTRGRELKDTYESWKTSFDAWAKANPDKKELWDQFHGDVKNALSRVQLPSFSEGDKVATRKASGKVLQALSKALPNLVGGSADLAPSNNTDMDYGDFDASTPTGRTLHFGVREHAMAAISNGMALYGGLRPFCATFLVFTDYMRPSMRLSALMKAPVIYVMTHDSIYLGEDGPTHQPIEHFAAVRAIPRMTFLRPGDAEETAQAWLMALENSGGPTVMALTRQGLTVYKKHDANWKENVRKGAYIVQEPEGKPDVVVVATGSEVNLALAAAELSGKKVRVVSMISQERFKAQDAAFKKEILPEGVRVIVAEVGIGQGWEGFVASEDDLFVLSDFGASGPGAEVAAHFGFTKENLAKLIDA